MRRCSTGLAPALAAICVVVGGCMGSSSSSSAPPPSKQLTVTLESFGQETQVKVPASVTAGVVQMRFQNRARGTHSAQLIRMGAGHDPLSALRAANAWAQKGKPLPRWIHLEGGFGTARSGQTLPGIAKLVPGNYAVVDLESHGKPVYGTFAVKGQAGHGKLPSTRSTVKAFDYGFSAHGLRRGASFLFRNAGRQPHQISAALLRKGVTLDDVRRYAKTQKGRSPVDESTAVSSAALDGGLSQVTTMDFPKPGRYVLVCFLPDRKGGPPHAAKGMVGVTVVH